MRRYQCHKQVSAAKIIGFERMAPDVWKFEIENGCVWAIDQGWMDKHKPEVGGYYVQYDDGYTSYSPAAAFEAGYTLIK